VEGEETPHPEPGSRVQEGSVMAGREARDPRAESWVGRGVGPGARRGGAVWDGPFGGHFPRLGR
jgi:hypothetical protein